MSQFILWSAAIAVIGLIVAIWLATRIKAIEVTNERAKEISSYIREGAMTYLNKQYRVLGAFITVVALLIFFIPGFSWQTAVQFVFGAVISIVAGNIGMRIATNSNAKTAEAVKDDIAKGLQVAFFGGSVAGLSIVALGLLGVITCFILFFDAANPESMFGFAFGASSVALFARVGGGIYTKAADVGADLVGKVEAGIPEDDPRNPAVIADNVGDNVGDVAGMGADLYETYVVAIISATALGALSAATFGEQAIFVPMLLAAMGILGTLAGNLVVKFYKNPKPHIVMNTAIMVANVTTIILAIPIIQNLLPGNFNAFWALVAGLVAGVVISAGTEYFTSDRYRPTQKIAEAGETGAATVIISGLASGMLSTIVPIACVSAATLISYELAGLYGISIAAIGMLASLGITLATDVYGPITDNAAGIAEMADMGAETRQKAEVLDAVGNSTAAIGKGFSVSAAALIGLVLLISYSELVHLEVINLLNAKVLVGLFIGGLLPFVFAALTMQSVGKAAYAMVKEVRRQFKEIPGLMEGTGKPDYKNCVAISTNAAIKEMMLPGILAIVTPICVGFGLGPSALGGFLAASMTVGFLMAIYMANAGGSWDNAKKYVEANHLGGKGSAVHKATVIGDTVGDPFKDTSGPAVNIMIKVVATTSVVIAPLLLLF
ncbi:MAG: sodium-translocating pyrophosphatase [Candidatus Buchananbacteria bacterium]|nr:sodium-translocating pyrophosphatase [Candidatus Buchananbacteria bacterium]